MNTNPRNVRNFWFRADVDGRNSPLESGPVAKEDGMGIVLWQRDQGQVTRLLEVTCWAEEDGTLRTDIRRSDDGSRIASFVTHR